MSKHNSFTKVVFRLVPSIVTGVMLVFFLLGASNTVKADSGLQSSLVITPTNLSQDLSQVKVGETIGYILEITNTTLSSIDNISISVEVPISTNLSSIQFNGQPIMPSTNYNMNGIEFNVISDSSKITASVISLASTKKVSFTLEVKPTTPLSNGNLISYRAEISKGAAVVASYVQRHKAIYLVPEIKYPNISLVDPDILWTVGLCIKNSGDYDAKNVDVTFEVPLQANEAIPLISDSTNAPHDNYNPNTRILHWHSFTITRNGGSWCPQLDLQVTPRYTSGLKELVSKVTVFDENTIRPQGEAKTSKLITAGTDAELSVTLSPQQSVVNIGQWAFFDLAIRNITKRDIAAGTNITNTFPLYHDAWSINCSSGSGSNSIGFSALLQISLSSEINANQSENCIVKARINGPLPAGVDNLFDSGVISYKQNPWGKIETTNIQPAQITVMAQPELQIQLIGNSSNSIILPGQELVFTATAINTGTQDATGVYFTVNPQGDYSSFVALTDNCTSLGQFNLNVKVRATDIKECTIKVKLSSEVPPTTTALIYDVSVHDDRNNGAESNLTDNISIVSVRTRNVPDVGVSISSPFAEAVPGGIVTYILTASNVGTTTSGVIMTAQLSSLVTGTTSSCSNTGNTINWNIGTLRENVPVSCTLTGTVIPVVPAATEFITITAQVNKTLGDPNDSNDHDNNSLILRSSPDLTTTIACEVQNKLIPEPGDTLDCDVTVANIGNEEATGGQLKIDFSSGLTFPKSSQCNPSVSGQLTCALSGNSTYSFKAQIQAGLAPNTVITATATVFHPDDNNRNNDKSSAVITVISSVDLAVSFIDNPSIKRDEPFTQVISITNKGKADVRGVSLFFDLPQETHYISSSGGLYRSNTTSWVISNLSGGQTLTKTITLQLNSNTFPKQGGDITYSAEVQSDGDVDTQNNIVTTTIRVSALNLPITNITITGLPVAIVNQLQKITAEISPSFATTPFTYQWGSNAPIMSGAITNVFETSWSTTGSHTVIVTANNGLTVPVQATHTITVFNGRIVTLTPDSETQDLPCGDDNVIITIPKGAVNNSTALICKLDVPAPLNVNGYRYANRVFELEAYQNNILQEKFNFAKPITIAVRYNNISVSVAVGNLVQMYQNEDGTWQDARCSGYPPYVRDNGYLKASVCHLTRFALFEQLVPVRDITLSGETTGLVGYNYHFTATITPDNVTLPVTYTWEATDNTLKPIPMSTVTNTNTVFAWTTSGVKIITITVTDATGQVKQDKYLIDIRQGVGCPNQPEKSVCVVDETGKPITDGKVTIYSGNKLGIANGNGILEIGNTQPQNLVAMHLISSVITAKGNHALADDNRNVFYDVYHTNIEIMLPNGDPKIIQNQIGSRYVITVSSKNTLVLFNLVVSLDWDANTETFSMLKTAFQKASLYLYDATDGQMAFGWVRFFDKGERSSDADIYFLRNQTGPQTEIGEPTLSLAHVILPPGWNQREDYTKLWSEQDGYQTIVHEFAHYALGLYDEKYIADTSNKLAPLIPAHCTDLIDNLLKFPNGKAASIMYWQYGDISEFEGKHNATEACRKTENYHINGKYAWDVIVSKYPGVLSPEMRGVGLNEAISGPDPIKAPFGTGTSLPFPLITYDSNSDGPSVKKFVVQATGNNGKLIGNVWVTERGSNYPIGSTNDKGEIVIPGLKEGTQLYFGAVTGAYYKHVLTVTSATGYTVSLKPQRCPNARLPFTNTMPYLDAFPLSNGLGFQLMNLASEYQVNLHVAPLDDKAFPTPLLQSSPTDSFYHGEIIQTAILDKGLGWISVEISPKDTNRSNDDCSPPPVMLFPYSFSQVDPNVENITSSQDGQAKFYLPSKAISILNRSISNPSVVVLKLMNLPSITPTLHLIGYGYQIKTEWPAPFEKDVLIQLSYNSKEVPANEIPSIYYWDINESNWMKMSSSFFTQSDGETLLYTWSHFQGTYAIFSEGELSIHMTYLPLITK